MSKVAVIYQNSAEYPNKNTLFRPHMQYPEYPFGEDLSSYRNDVYEMIREGFYHLGYDNENYGTKQWNPLGHIIKPDDNVLLKPNMVMDINLGGEGIECLYTQPCVVAAIIDYVVIALKGKGKIIVGDAPMQECAFDRLTNEAGYCDLISYYQMKGTNIELVDFRELTSIVKDGIHYSTINANSKGTVIDLAGDSEFAVYNEEYLKKMRITNYDPRILTTHHTAAKNEYYISDYVLAADVVINMPKPKTHRKAGVTIALKNMVGINVRKEYLPHHTVGDKSSGKGDEYLEKNIVKIIRGKILDCLNIYTAEKKYRMAKVARFFYHICCAFSRFADDHYAEGSWYGNETICRTIADLNKILIYADKNGKLCDNQQRKTLIVADMIISGEKEGPVCPSPKQVGIIAIGENAVHFDEVISKLMGADISRIPTLRVAKKTYGKYKLSDPNDKIHILSNDIRWSNKDLSQLGSEDLLYYEPTSGWSEVFFKKGERLDAN